MNWLFRMLLHSNTAPRVIDRRTHAALDYLTVGYFLCLAGFYWGRHRRAAFTAIFNGAAVLGASMFTDYPGALARVIPFETHGKIDVMQMSAAALMPTALGFADDLAAVPFMLQAGNEAMVVSATDWEAAADAAVQEPVPLAS